MVSALEFYQFYLNHWSGSIDYKKPIDCSYNQGYGNNCEYCWTQWIKNSISNPSCNSFVLIQVSKIPTKKLKWKKKHLVKVGCFLAEFWLWFQLKFLKNLNKKKYPKKWFPEIFFFQKFIAEWFQFFIDNKYDQKCQKIMLVWSMYKKLELFRNGSLKKKSPKLSFSVGRYIVKISSYVLTLICTCCLF